MQLLRRVSILAALLVVPVLLALASQSLAERPGAPELPVTSVAVEIDPAPPAGQPGGGRG